MPLHKEILTDNQRELLPIIKHFAHDFGLVGGTAIALQIGHRESIDFDLFTKDPSFEFDTAALKRAIGRLAIIQTIAREREEELTFTLRDVQFTFFHFDFRMPFSISLNHVVDMPDLLTLAAMKAYALGYRAKWKDYVDLYFILRDHYSISDISGRAKELFTGKFNERLFRQQLPFFEGMNRKEPVIYKPGFEVPDEEIRRALTEYSLL